MRRISTLLAALVAASLPGCIYYTGDDPPADEPPVVDSGDYFQFVQTGWLLPTTTTQARDIGLDLDGDGYIDNLIGQLFSAFNGIGLEIGLASEEAFFAGDLVLLHSLRADSLADDDTVSWQLLSGAPSESPLFDGTDALTAVSVLGSLVGSNRGGLISADYGGATLFVPMFPGQPALALPLDHAYVDVQFGANRSTARIAGSLNAAIVNDVLLPRLAEQVIVHMTTHPDHPFTDSAFRIFDANRDGVVSVEEIADASITQSLFAPDLDLDEDGENDHLSIGLGFEVVPATFNRLGD